MHLSERKLQILETVVSFYNKTGEPVSSKAISQLFGSVSSATIRNEMASLEQLGLLKQPHTSAGRIPTYQGYRLYIDNLLTKKEGFPPQIPREIDTVLKVRDFNPLHFLSVAGNQLAKTTGCTAIISLPSATQVQILGLEFMMINQKTVVATIVFSTSGVKNRICRLDCAVESDLLEKFFQLMNEEIKKKSVEEVTPEFLETLVLTLGAYSIALSPLLSGILELCKEPQNTDIIVKGQENLLHYQDVEFEIAKIFDALSCKETVFRLLDFNTNETSVIMGEETDIQEMKGSSIITTRYHLGNAISGTISIIGPMRLDYGTAIPHLEYFAQVIEETLSQSLDNLL